MIRSLYQRLGRRYVSTVLVLIFLNFYLVYLLGLGILTIYLDMSGAEFMRLVLVMVVVESGYTVSMPLLLRRRLGPVSRWLDGAHDPEATLAAWRAAATVPLDWLRDLHRHWLPLPGFVAFAAYAVWELDLPVWNILILLPAIGVVTLYGIAVVYFILEQAMRPLLEDLARQSPAATQPEATGLSLRTRLLVTLSAISISTGVIVVAPASLPPGPHPGCADRADEEKREGEPPHRVLGMGTPQSHGTPSRARTTTIGPLHWRRPPVSLPPG